MKLFYQHSKAELEKHLPEFDKKDINKLYCCAEYASDIFTYLRKREEDTAAKYGCLKNQAELNEKMRAILMDWCSAVSDKFNLLPETLFLTANIIDRYLEHDPISKAKLQAVGAAAFVIASKYEEIYPPEIKDFIRVTERAVSKDEIIRMEKQILKQLKFDLSCASVLRFVQRMGKILSLTDTVYNLALYLCEMQLQDYGMLKHSPSLVAASASFLSYRLIKGSCMEWSALTKTESGHSEEEVRKCAMDLLSVLQAQEKIGLSATKKKYANKKYMEVSKLKLDYPSSL